MTPPPELPQRTTALRVGPRAAVVLALAGLIGLAMFCWPLIAPPEPEATAHAGHAPLLFVLLLPVVLALVLAEISEGGIDPKTLALLGVLAAVNAALRPLGAGTAGIETVFFLLILAGRVFGPGFGYALGAISLFASALLTAGVGPWLPFQMMAAGWVGLGAGLLPRRLTGRAEIALLAAYGVLAAYAFGFVMNLWFWPFATGPDTQLSIDPEAGPLENLRTFVLYTLATSTFGWDTGRAVTNAVAICALGPAVLITLRRAARRAAFDAPVTFTAAPAGTAPGPGTDPGPAGPASDAGPGPRACAVHGPTDEERALSP
ncbi:ECF transporter S component [Streptomyces marincola]|uniref:ECF transporter S component n=1 Tax=Streptomyces marincola TaxID=2878388 RepID=UPI001CF0FD5A|nr:ECF transporter S component [Streptomyces marincola]UCM86973.1 ECF transporter S component [Streptomyces marincola]